MITGVFGDMAMPELSVQNQIWTLSSEAVLVIASLLKFLTQVLHSNPVKGELGHDCCK